MIPSGTKNLVQGLKFLEALHWWVLSVPDERQQRLLRWVSVTESARDGHNLLRSINWWSSSAEMVEPRDPESAAFFRQLAVMKILSLCQQQSGTLSEASKLLHVWRHRKKSGRKK